MDLTNNPDGMSRTHLPNPPIRLEFGWRWRCCAGRWLALAGAGAGLLGAGCSVLALGAVCTGLALFGWRCCAGWRWALAGWRWALAGWRWLGWALSRFPA